MNRLDRPRPDEVEILERWPERVEAERSQYEGEPNLDRLASGFVWLKCAVFALFVDAPLILLAQAFGGWVDSVFEWLAFLVWLAVMLVSVVLVATDDNRGQI